MIARNIAAGAAKVWRELAGQLRPQVISAGRLGTGRDGHSVVQNRRKPQANADLYKVFRPSSGVWRGTSGVEGRRQRDPGSGNNARCRRSARETAKQCGASCRGALWTDRCVGGMMPAAARAGPHQPCPDGDLAYDLGFVFGGGVQQYRQQRERHDDSYSSTLRAKISRARIIGA
ncbi:hypothetical protein [Fodinicola feengrottensis]|uniref:hypothetical protein n=1 Tax=Fodinicola feengrottensis TaxID=435914 RepID=UPI0013D7DBB7|nr:hypothetical protein [Fodinicola feengrottensis]